MATPDELRMWESHLRAVPALADLPTIRRPGSVKSQAERVLGTRERRALVGRERRC